MEGLEEGLTEELYSKKITCLNCGQSFNTLKVRSRFSIPTKLDSDLCPHFQEGVHNPHFYFVKICPECGFAFTDEFSSIFPAGTKEQIKLKITSEWKKKEDFGKIRDARKGIESLKLGLYSATLKREKHSVLAGLCLRLAWIYRTLENKAEEDRFMGLALQEYDQSFIYSDFAGTSMSELRVLYLLGELSRRLGQYAQAITYFSKIAEHPNRNDEPKMLEWARRQWQETVAEYKENR